MAESSLQRSAPVSATAPRPPEASFGVSGEELLRRWSRGMAGAIVGGLLGFPWSSGCEPSRAWTSSRPSRPATRTSWCRRSPAPFGFLVGIGAFDYWLRWALGRADRRRRTTADHGADSWRDYFSFNTDHKVIGIQYIVTTFFFFFIGGLLAMLIRAELAQPGTQIVDPRSTTGSSRLTRRS